jgi:glycosyltransferase involved in cell wall biosynthesis
MDQAVLSPRHWYRTLSAWQTARLEGNFSSEAHALITATELAASRLKKFAPESKITVLPTSVDSARFKPLQDTQGKTLLFTGLLDRPANVEALNWFGSEILPRLRARLNERVPPIVVAGARPTAKLIAQLQDWGVEVHANPESLDNLIKEASVVFLPIQTGDAAHLRILEAMASGRPVVTTGRGAAGLVLTPTVDAFVAETPDAFALALVKLIENPSIHASMKTKGLETIRTRYDITCFDQPLAKLLGYETERE